MLMKMWICFVWSKEGHFSSSVELSARHVEMCTTNYMLEQKQFVSVKCL
jgi:hypothetical protein